MSFLSHTFKRRSPATANEKDGGYKGEISDGSLKYVGAKGGNNSQTSYQEASGAPVEVESPLGYSVGSITIVFLKYVDFSGE